MQPRNRPPRVEALEERLMLDSTAGAFAHFDVPVTAGVPASVVVHVRAADFTMPRGRVMLSFEIHGEGADKLDPGAPDVLSRRRNVGESIVRSRDGAADSSSLAIVQLRQGDFTVRWRGERGTSGPSDLHVFLAGDSNGDYRVDSNDIELIRAHSVKEIGRSGYLATADINRNGTVNRADVRIARLNLGAATSVRAPAMTANLAPDSDPNGNGVVLRPEVKIVGQTQAGSIVRLAVRHDSSPVHTSAAGETGRFQVHANLQPGLNVLRIEATNGFGQSIATERVVRYGDVIVDWNASMLNVIRDWTTLSNDPYPNRIVPERPPVAARNLAMLHAAMVDAINAIERTHEPYRVNLSAPDGASPVAAAAAAAHRVATNLYREPDELAVFDAALAEALATVADGPAESLGVDFGRQVGAAILAWRANDGASAVVPYTPGKEPGDWNRTFPDFLPPLLPQWPSVLPFAMTRGDQFRPSPPPALDSAEYAAAVNEVREIGGLNSTTRTPDQTEIALFWADGGGTFTPPGHWNQIAADVALERGNTLVENARLFALLNIALADAGISCWDAKYAYNFWRPIDAIRRADTDGNDATVADPTWTTLIKTPPFPTYTSGHSTFSGAAAAVLSFIFGPDTSFRSTADGHTGFTQRPLDPRQVATREFASFAAAADEAALSRLYGGIHFSFDNDVGLASGRALGNFVVETQLRPA